MAQPGANDLHIITIGGVDEEVAREALRLASHKLSVKSKFVEKAKI